MKFFKKVQENLYAQQGLAAFADTADLRPFDFTQNIRFGSNFYTIMVTKIRIFIICFFELFVFFAQLIGIFDFFELAFRFFAIAAIV